MYISKLKLHNFKGYKGNHEINFDKGINFFVGDNNCGKSTIFEAIDFIRSKRDVQEIISKTSAEDDYVSVEIELKGDDILSVTEIEDLRKYRSFIVDSNGDKTLRIMRSSKEEEVNQSGKPKNLSIGHVRVFNEQKNQYENPTGIDTTINALFDAQFVWADTNSGDISDFSKTKISGKIINTITKDFATSDTWKAFQNSHRKTFGDGEDSLSRTLKPIEEKIQSILTEQYGETEVRFTFSLPEIESFFKTGNITLSENGIETKSSEKGTGMQRALALSLIQVYADIINSRDNGISKPLLFFIDEPETFLHPQAQNKLLDALEKISQNSQIFIITHSPYLLKKYKKETHSINIFSKENGVNMARAGNKFNLFGKSSPTWGEINYYAFGVLSAEFHNELYGFIQARAAIEDEKYYNEKDFDNYLASREKSHILKNVKYNHLFADGTTKEYSTTLPTKIRNIIHHPENHHNNYTDAELGESIELLIPLLT